MRAATQQLGRHTVVVRLLDRPGALYRAIGLVRRRGYNVSSLVVGASEEPGTSRMVLVVEAADVRQVVAQLSRLVDVLSVTEIATEPARIDAFIARMLRFDIGQLARTGPIAIPRFTPLSLSTAQELAR
jgi:acetolactate synthase-1/3 small subunit